MAKSALLLIKPLALALLLASCASLGHDEPAVCDGRHKRPANPYGSVLDPSPSTLAQPASSEPDQTPAGSSQAGCA